MNICFMPIILLLYEINDVGALHFKTAFHWIFITVSKTIIAKSNMVVSIVIKNRVNNLAIQNARRRNMRGPSKRLHH